MALYSRGSFSARLITPHTTHHHLLVRDLHFMHRPNGLAFLFFLSVESFQFPPLSRAVRPAAASPSKNRSPLPPSPTRAFNMLDADAGWNPLILSTVAGMSTCLGALIVFCHPLEEDEPDCTDEETTQLTGDTEALNAGENPQLQNNTQRAFSIISRGRRKVSPSTMAFSLALAGSVMITVSVVSIGPECLAAASMPQNADLDLEENSFFIFGMTLMPIYSWVFLHRLLSFGFGCLLYFIMSKYAYPEPEEILSAHSETLFNRTGGIQIERSFSDSSKCSDDGETQSGNNANKPGSESGRSKSELTSRSVVRRSGSSAESSVEMATFSNEVAVKDESSPGKSKAIFRESHAEQQTWVSYLRSFFTGSDLATSEARRANRVAMLLFFSLLIHNFPEGLAVAASALESDQLGLTVTVGIMIHNIPEGIAVAIPCLKARPDSPWLAFVLASVSGLAEPAGAFLSLVILRGSTGMEEGSLENVLAFVAGIMITVSILELLPEARRHTVESTTGTNAYYAGLVVGFVVMVATELGMSV